MKHIISLGAGVQSSTMALMAAHGEITPMPECAIFADTQAEPTSVYKWLDWLEGQLPFEVHRVTAGNLAEDSIEIRLSKKSGKYYQRNKIPMFVKSPDGTTGIIFRKCTSDYKVTPIIQLLRKLTGKEPTTQWMGISIDEAIRTRESRHSWIQNRYPLIEKGMSRNDCLAWMKRNGYPEPPRSACTFCPYHSDKEWLRLRNEEPEDFQRAVEWERASQENAKRDEVTRGELFVHRSCVPLDQVVFRHENQPSMFGNECEGMCGV